MVLLDEKQSFSQSRIWQLQRDYFSQAGIEAWRSGEAPHYISSNPVVGKTYAELVLAFLRDLSLRGQTAETVYLLAMKLSAWRDDVDIADAQQLLQHMQGDQERIWAEVVAYLVPGTELKAQYAFMDLWEVVFGSD